MKRVRQAARARQYGAGNGPAAACGAAGAALLLLILLWDGLLVAEARPEAQPVSQPEARAQSHKADDETRRAIDTRDEQPGPREKAQPAPTRRRTADSAENRWSLRPPAVASGARQHRRRRRHWRRRRGHRRRRDRNAAAAAAAAAVAAEDDSHLVAKRHSENKSRRSCLPTLPDQHESGLDDGLSRWSGARRLSVGNPILSLHSGLVPGVQYEVQVSPARQQRQLVEVSLELGHLLLNGSHSDEKRPAARPLLQGLEGDGNASTSSITPCHVSKEGLVKSVVWAPAAATAAGREEETLLLSFVIHAVPRGESSSEIIRLTSLSKVENGSERRSFVASESRSLAVRKDCVLSLREIRAKSPVQLRRILPPRNGPFTECQILLDDLQGRTNERLAVTWTKGAGAACDGRKNAQLLIFDDVNSTSIPANAATFDGRDCSMAFPVHETGHGARLVLKNLAETLWTRLEVSRGEGEPVAADREKRAEGCTVGSSHHGGQARVIRLRNATTLLTLARLSESSEGCERHSIDILAEPAFNLVVTADEVKLHGEPLLLADQLSSTVNPLSNEDSLSGLGLRGNALLAANASCSLAVARRPADHNSSEADSPLFAVHGVNCGLSELDSMTSVSSKVSFQLLDANAEVRLNVSLQQRHADCPTGFSALHGSSVPVKCVKTVLSSEARAAAAAAGAGDEEQASWSATGKCKLIISSQAELESLGSILAQRAAASSVESVRVALEPKFYQKLKGHIPPISDVSRTEDHGSPYVPGCLVRLQTLGGSTSSLRPPTVLWDWLPEAAVRCQPEYTRKHVLLCQPGKHKGTPEDSRRPHSNSSKQLHFCHAGQPILLTPNASISMNSKSMGLHRGQDNTYRPSAYCNVTFQGSPNSTLLLELPTLSLEAGINGTMKGWKYCIYDALRIQLGTGESYYFCGDWSQQKRHPQLVISPLKEGLAPTVTLTFTSDSDQQASGFTAKVSSAVVCGAAAAAAAAAASVPLEEQPAKLLRAPVGEIAIKHYDNFHTETRCIEAPKNTRIQLWFQTFDLEWESNCSSDFVLLTEKKKASSDGQDSSSREIARLCGNLKDQIRSLRFTSEWSVLCVSFSSDAFLTGDGFEAHWSLVRTGQSRREVNVLDNHGFLNLPDFWDQEQHVEVVYDRPIIWEFTFIAPVAHRIVLEFVEDRENRTESGPEAEQPPAVAEAGEGEDEAENEGRQKRDQSWSLLASDAARSCGLKDQHKLQQQPQMEMRLAIALDGRRNVYNRLCPGERGHEAAQLAIFVSNGNKLKLKFELSSKAAAAFGLLDRKRAALFGLPLRIKHKAESIYFEHVSPAIRVPSETSSRVRLTNTNAPLACPENLKLRTDLIAESGRNIRLALPVREWQQNCTHSYLEIEDPYQTPSRPWKLCHFLDNVNMTSDAFVYIQSYMNVIRLRQVTGPEADAVQPLKFQLLAQAMQDHDIQYKVIQMTKAAESDPNKDNEVCDANLCFNGGFCNPYGKNCVCKGHFIGRHCLQTSCDVQPCQNGGVCELTPDSYRCHCPGNFGGPLCHERLHPCLKDPCNGHGICVDKRQELERRRKVLLGQDHIRRLPPVEEDGREFMCKCHLWWTGPTCNLRMTNIPFKPLSERMLEEPFWLGLITVTVVLILIGMCYFLKKHLPERLEKFLLEDGEHGKLMDRNYDSGGGASRYYRHYTPQVSIGSDFNDLPPPMDRSSSLDVSPGATAKSLLSKLSVRKPSILSISSNASSPGYCDRKNSTSQEDLFLKRTPSPKRSRFLSPRDQEERRKILKMLVTPQNSTETGPGQTTKKKRNESSCSFDHMILKAARSAENLQETSSSTLDVMPTRKESSLSLQIPGAGGLSPSCAMANKKVTFSQVVDQMACSLSDSSSMSDLSSCAEDFKLNVSSHIPHQRRARKLIRSARLPSKRRYGTSSSNGCLTTSNGNSGSEEVFESSMESLESNNATSIIPMRPSLSVPSPGGGSGLPDTGQRSRGHRQLQKISSADSLLSMIRNLTVSNTGKANFASTPSSPQFSDIGGYDSSGFPSPMNTPDTPNFTADFTARTRGNGGEQTQIRVEIHDYPSSSSPGPGNSTEHLSMAGDSDSSLSAASTASSGVTMTLEVPGFHFGKCLSPIKELPSPLPTPSGSPLPHRLGAGHHRGATTTSGDDASSNSSSNSNGSNSHASLSSRRSSFRNRFSRKKSLPAGSLGDKEASSIGLSSPSKAAASFVMPLLRRFSYGGGESPADGSQQQETSFVTAPTRRLTIPTITLTTHCDDEKEPCYQREDKNSLQSVRTSQLANNILIPQLVISCEDDDMESPYPQPMCYSPGIGSPPAININITVQPPTPSSPSPPPYPSLPPLPTIIVESDADDIIPHSPDISSLKSVAAPGNGSQPSSPKCRPPPIQIHNSNFQRDGSEDWCPPPSAATAMAKNESPRDTSSMPTVMIELEDVKNSQQRSTGRNASGPAAEKGRESPKPGAGERQKNRKGSLVKQKAAIVEPEGLAFEEGKDYVETSYMIEPATPKEREAPVHSHHHQRGGLINFDTAPRLRSQSVDMSNKVIVAASNTMTAAPLTIREHRLPRLTFEGVAEEKEGSMMLRPLDSHDKKDNSWKEVKLGSPTLKKHFPSFIGEPISHEDEEGSHWGYGKPQSLDLPGMPPAITVTTISEMESDGDSPIIKNCPGSSGMHYLSPYPVLQHHCGSRTTSESNLSSSGYSSMASPGPSRSGSSNPLCISESEDTTSSTPTSTNLGFFNSSASGIGPGIGGACVWIRRPNPLLKSPSMDSESSDPAHPAPCTAAAGSMRGHHIGGVQSAAQRRANASIVLRRMQERSLRYRTDSETTDDQCLPESISEACNDSAIESTGEEHESDPLGELVSSSPKQSEEEVLVQDEDPGQQQQSPVQQQNTSPKLPSYPTTPNICMEVRDSSTESDKTVLSIGSVLEHKSQSTPAGASLSFELPRIIVDEASTPRESSDSSDLDETCISQPQAIVSLSETAPQREQALSSLPKCPSLFVLKACSVPPMSNLTLSSSLDYEQLSTTSSTGVSASSSRSDSPLSERHFDKCSSSLLSLNKAMVRLTDSDGAFDYKLGGKASSSRYSDCSETTKKKKLRRRRKRTSSSSSKSEATLTAPEESSVPVQALKDPQFDIEGSSGSCSPRKSLMKRRLRSHMEGTEKEELASSSSNDSLHSNSSFSRPSPSRGFACQGANPNSSSSSSSSAVSSAFVSNSFSSCDDVASKKDTDCGPPMYHHSSFSSTSSSSATSKTGSPLGSLTLLPMAASQSPAPNARMSSRKHRHKKSTSNTRTNMSIS